MKEFNKRADGVSDFINRARADSSVDTDVKYMIHDLKVMVFEIDKMIKANNVNCIEALNRLSDVAYDLYNIGRPVYEKWGDYAYDKFDEMQDQLVP